MNQLGHTSKTVTERHYINREFVVPDYRAATERLAPTPGRAKAQRSGSAGSSAAPRGSRWSIAHGSITGPESGHAISK